MSRRHGTTQVIMALLVALLLGGSMVAGLWAIGGGQDRNLASYSSDVAHSTARALPNVLAPTPTNQVKQALDDVPPPTPTVQPEARVTPTRASEASPMPQTLPSTTPLAAPVEAAAPRGTDLKDVVLLFDSSDVTAFDVNFCRVAEFYGLLCQRVAIDATPVTADLLRDADGDSLKLIGISGRNLAEGRLSADEIKVLQGLVRSGAHLIVSKFDRAGDGVVLAQTVRVSALTNGAVSGLAAPDDSQLDWYFSEALPEITREFTGQHVVSNTDRSQRDLAIQHPEEGGFQPLIQSHDDDGAPYTLFGVYPIEQGAIWLDAGEPAASLETTRLTDEYRDWHISKTSRLLPLMMTMRYALGDEVWHRDQDYANLTIDGPPLIMEVDALDYRDLLDEMQRHDFHTTIAFVPVNWSTTEADVRAIFLQHPERYSLVQHGNNHDGYEFYRYEVAPDDLHEGQKFPARPLAEQEDDILEGLGRMDRHRQITGIDDDRVMIFPYGVSPEDTLVLLKKYNYLATVNGQSKPLDAEAPADWDYGAYPARLDFANFAMVVRRGTSQVTEGRAGIAPFVFDLFVDQPALAYTHAFEDELFGRGIDAFSPIADELNALATDLRWASLGEIARHLYLEKRNDDGSTDVRFFTRHLVLDDAVAGRVYHLAKEETLNVPIVRVTVNGDEFPYRVKDGWLRIDLRVAEQARDDVSSRVEVEIFYDDGLLPEEGPPPGEQSTPVTDQQVARALPATQQPAPAVRRAAPWMAPQVRDR